MRRRPADRRGGASLATRLLAWPLLALPLLAGAAAAGPIDDARVAAQRGETGEALRLLRPLAEAGEAEAQAMLGAIHQAGSGVPQDFAAAVTWYREAARGGDAAAQNALAALHVRGLGVPRDDVEALRLFSLAAGQGDPRHQFDLAVMYDNGRGTAEDPALAAEWYAKAAAQGLPEAEASLGVLYQSGRGLARDPARAAELYRRAADRGDARAQNNLGLLYVRGEGVPRDLESAALWFHLAAEQGLATAIGNLAVMYENGFGVAQDDATAVDLYRAAGQGASAGALPLERMVPLYDLRLAPPQESPEALRAYRGDAARGDPVAQFVLGFLLGRPGRDRDLAAAAHWYAQSAERGMPMAMANLGLAYAQGAGVPQDYVLAYMWVNLATAGGLDPAAELREALAERMTVQQLNEAQSLSAARWTGEGGLAANVVGNSQRIAMP